MRTIKYKQIKDAGRRLLLTSALVLLPAAVLLLPALLLATRSASAVTGPVAPQATEPPGTCFLTVTGENDQVGPCSTLAPTATDVDGNPLNSADCYDVTEAETGINATQVNCNNTPYSGTVTTPTSTCVGKTQPSTDGFGNPDCITPSSNDPATAGCTNSNTASSASDESAGNSCNIIAKYVDPAIQLLSAGVALAVTISIIMGAIQYSASGGDPGKTAAAKNRIRNALLSLVALIFMYTFLQFLVPGGIFNS